MCQISSRPVPRRSARISVHAPDPPVVEDQRPPPAIPKTLNPLISSRPSTLLTAERLLQGREALPRPRCDPLQDHPEILDHGGDRATRE